MMYVSSCAVVRILVMLVPGSILAETILANCTSKFSPRGVVVTCLGTSSLARVDCVWHHWFFTSNTQLTQTSPDQNGNHSITCETTIEQPEVGEHTIELTVVSTNLNAPPIRGNVQFTIESNKTEIERSSNKEVTSAQANENSSRAVINVTSEPTSLSEFGTYTMQDATPKKESIVDSNLPIAPVVKAVTKDSLNIRIIIIAVASILTLTVVGVVTLTAIVRRLCSRPSTHTYDAAYVDKTNCNNIYNNVGELHSSKIGLRHELKTNNQDGLSRTVSPDGLVYVSVVIDTKSNRPGVHQTKSRSDPPRTNYTEIDFEATARAKITGEAKRITR